MISEIGQQIAEQSDSLSQSSISELCTMTQTMMSMALEDSDLSIAALDRQQETSIASRCINLAVLAINTGIELELSDSDIGNLGTAGLLHEMGLFLMPETLHSTTNALSDNESWEFRKHPILALNLFKRFSCIPE